MGGAVLPDISSSVMVFCTNVPTNYGGSGSPTEQLASRASTMPVNRAMKMPIGIDSAPSTRAC